MNADIEDLGRAQSLLSAEKRTLEMIMSGASLSQILNELCRMIDAHATDAFTTILLLDPGGEYLRPGAGPSAPDGWFQATTPLRIGPSAGSCGAAAFLKERVIASDIAADPLWANYRDAALRFGVRASWSQPVLSRSGEVLGTFAMCFAEPRGPSDSDLQLIEAAGQIACIAIERKRTEEVVRAAQARFEGIVEIAQDAIISVDSNQRITLFNQGAEKVFGYTQAEVIGYPLDLLLPRRFEDVHRKHIEEFARSPDVARTMAQRREVSGRRKDGSEFPAEASISKLALGGELVFTVILRDITESKKALEELKVRQELLEKAYNEIETLRDQLHKENIALREEIDHTSMFEEIVGSSAPLRTVLRQVAKVASADSTVLILGETGTGKELIARAIHKLSNRSAQAFIRVNCAAIPPSLVASELFGHEKGAFTGAVLRRIGRFEAANRGTIFLDEIGELPTETQVALLRVLQEREFERVGGGHSIHVDVRVLAATNRNLEASVASGAFRKDLFYRLNVFPIHVPSLRERRDDIPILVEYLIERYGKKVGKKFRVIDKRTLELLQFYSWPGNVRELQNVIERAVIICEDDTFFVDETWFKHEAPQKATASVPLEEDLADRERERIEAALAESHGRVSGPAGAATKLGLPARTLDSKIKRLRIDKHRIKSQTG